MSAPIASDLAHLILTVIDDHGYLKPAARKDDQLLPTLEYVIASRIRENRQRLLNFINWWGKHGHKPHIEHIEGYRKTPDWTECTEPLCASLYKTALDIEDELKASVAPRHDAHPTLP